MNPAERLEFFNKIIEELIDENSEAPVLVEGIRDVEALRTLGLKGEIIKVHGGLSLVQLSEEIARTHDKAIILTDWDRKGGSLARRLSQLLENDSVKYDLDFRRKLARVAGSEAKTVEALASLARHLEERVSKSGKQIVMEKTDRWRRRRGEKD